MGVPPAVLRRRALFWVNQVQLPMHPRLRSRPVPLCWAAGCILHVLGLMLFKSYGWRPGTRAHAVGASRHAAAALPCSCQWVERRPRLVAWQGMAVRAPADVEREPWPWPRRACCASCATARAGPPTGARRRWHRRGGARRPAARPPTWMTPTRGPRVARRSCSRRAAQAPRHARCAFGLALVTPFL
jgi:hypothetical protein